MSEALSQVLIVAKDSDHENVELTNEQFHNYRKLAAYLSKVADSKHFDMGSFAYKMVPEDDDDGEIYEIHVSLEPDKVAVLTNTCTTDHHDCGSAGCAIGHALFAGIGKGAPELEWDSWWSYTERNFGTSDGRNAFTWCFGSEWKSYDNTPKGAAKRILYMLDNGAPAYHYGWENNGSNDGYFDTDRYDPAPVEA